MKTNKPIKITNKLPDGFLSVPPKNITKLFDRPTLIHLKGKREPPAFISVLLHGNEFSGLKIIQKFLKKYEEKDLPKSLVLFIGNPLACSKGRRQLDNQPDFNRIWNLNPPHPIAKEVLKYVRQKSICWAVDIHNNSGKNPLYSCINKKDKRFVRLAGMFSKKVVYFTQPDSVLSMALSKICPAIVIEAGLPGKLQGITAGVRFIQKLLDEKEKWENKSFKLSHIYSTVAAIHIDKNSNISFDSRPVLKKKHLSLTNRLDEFNFKKLKKGTILGKINSSRQIQLLDNKGKNIFDQFFSIKENNWVVKKSFIPSMFTKNTRIAKSDSLAYAMKQIHIDQFFKHP